MIITIALGIVLGLILLALLPAIIGVGIILIFSAIVIGIIFLIITFAIYTDWSFLATLNWNLIFSCLLVVLVIYFFIKLKDISNSFKFLRIYLKFGFLRTSPESVALYEKHIQIEKDKIEKNKQIKLDKIKNEEENYADKKFNKLFNEVKLLENKINTENDFLFRYSNFNKEIIVEPLIHKEGQFQYAYLQYVSDKKSDNNNKYYLYYFFKDHYDDGVRYADTNAKPIVRELAKIIGKTLAVISNNKPQSTLSNEILEKVTKEFSNFLSWFEEKHSTIFDKETSIEVIRNILKNNKDISTYDEGDEMAIIITAYAADPITIINDRKKENWDENIEKFMKLNELDEYNILRKVEH